MTSGSGHDIHTANAIRHVPQYFVGKLKRYASVLFRRIWKIQIKARRGATVHVYTWACRLIVFLVGFPEPGG